MQGTVLYITLFVKWYELYPRDQERSEPSSYGDGTRLIQVPLASVSLDLAFLYIAFWISVQVVILTCLTWGQPNCFFAGEKRRVSLVCPWLDIGV